jgi:hypothetical protein
MRHASPAGCDLAPGHAAPVDTPGACVAGLGPHADAGTITPIGAG